MATLYWGGGTGTWDGFTTTNWYTDLARTVLSTRAPIAEDDVVFDSTSNATGYTVTISNNTSVCRDLTISGPASGNVTVAGSNQLYIYGSLTLPATGITRTYTGALFFYGTGSHNITTNGVTLASTLTFNGTGTYTLQDALNTGASGIAINAGTLNTNGKNVTTGNITSVTTTTGTLTLGASTVSASSLGAAGPLTINAGTSSITLSNSQPNIGGGADYTGNTFYNVTFSSSAITTGNIRGTNTFNNLTFTTSTTVAVSNIVLFGNQTVNGTLTITGQSSVNRYFVRSNKIGTTRTLTVATVGTLTDVDFRDVTVAGASSPWAGTRLGDCGGNTNITFPAAKTVYWKSIGSALWTDNVWATASGGSVSTANFPLAQDTAIIDDAGLSTGNSIIGGAFYNLKTLTSTKTNAYIITSSPTLYGDLTLTASTNTSSSNPTFSGRVTQNLTSAGNTINRVTCNSFGASVKLADNTTLTNWTITSGGLDTDNKNFTVSSSFLATTDDSAGAFSLTLGSSAVSLPSLVATVATAPTMTVSAGTSTITLTTANANLGFFGQTLTWYNVTWSIALTGGSIGGTNTFNNVTITSPTATDVVSLQIGGNQTINGTLAFGGGTSVTQRLGIVSNTPGTQRTITAATVTGLSDIDFRDINGAGAGTWTGGTRIGDCGGNSGIGFTAAKTVYWNLAGTQNWSATGWATTSTGSPAANNFPLAQDTATFTDAGSAGTVSINSTWNIGTIDASGRTSAMTLAGGGLSIYGNVTYGSGVTPSLTGAFAFRGTSTQTFITAGKSLVNNIQVNNPSCTFRHGDAYTSTGSISVFTGNYTTQNYNVSCSLFSGTSSTGAVRSVTLGTSTITVTGATAWAFNVATGLTFSGASSTINLSSTSAKTFEGGGLTYGTVSSTGGTTNALTITGSNTFTTFTNTARTYLVFTSGTTQTVTNFTYSGASGSVVRWNTSIPGQRATLSTSSGAVGANSVDGGNNSGLTFTGSSPDYFYVKDIALAAAAATGKFFLMF